MLLQAQQVAQQLAGSQQTQQAATSAPTSAPRRDRLKRDLSRLIDKYEKQQTRWGSPRRAASMQHLLPLDHRYCPAVSAVCAQHGVSSHTPKCSFAVRLVRNHKSMESSPLVATARHAKCLPSNMQESFQAAYMANIPQKLMLSKGRHSALLVYYSADLAAVRTEILMGLQT